MDQHYLGIVVGVAHRKIIVSKAENTLEELRPYANDEDIYVSYINSLSDFSGKQHPKLGINPKSSFSTPLGIYTYPLHRYWGEMEKFNSAREVPFRSDSEYIAIIRKKKDAKFIDDMDKNYTEENLEQDVVKIKNYFSSLISMDGLDEIQKRSFEKAKRNKPISKLWNLVRHLSIFVATLKKVMENKMPTDKLEYEFIELISKEDPSKFYTIERNKLNVSALVFNKILREVLEYDGFSDISGEGHIHENEPVQAVFLNPRSYEIIKIIKNIDDKMPLKSMEYERLLVKISNQTPFNERQWKNILHSNFYIVFYPNCPFPKLKNAYKDKYVHFMKNFAGKTLEAFTSGNSSLCNDLIDVCILGGAITKIDSSVEPIIHQLTYEMVKSLCEDIAQGISYLKSESLLRFLRRVPSPDIRESAFSLFKNEIDKIISSELSLKDGCLIELLEIGRNINHIIPYYEELASHIIIGASNRIYDLCKQNIGEYIEGEGVFKEKYGLEFFINEVSDIGYLISRFGPTLDSASKLEEIIGSCESLIENVIRLEMNRDEDKAYALREAVKKIRASTPFNLGKINAELEQKMSKFIESE